MENKETYHVVQYGKKASRRDYSKVSSNLPLPDLTEVQTASFEWFLKEGIREVFNDIYPIKSYNGNITLRLLDYSFDDPAESIEECKAQEKSYCASLKAKMCLTVKDEDGEASDVSDEVFFGDFPMMTPTGTFIINGAERVIVSQIVRSPGAYFDIVSDEKTGRDTYTCELIPSRGTWLEFMTDTKKGSNQKFLNVSIDRKHKIISSILFKAIGMSLNEEKDDDGFNTANMKKFLKAMDFEVYDDVVDDKEESPFLNDYRLLYTGVFGKYEEVLNTLSLDSGGKDADSRITTRNDALIAVYQNQRTDEVATVEGALTLMDQKFFDYRRYDLTKAGRYKVRKKLNILDRMEHHMLCEDLVGADGTVLLKKDVLIDRDIRNSLRDEINKGICMTALPFTHRFSHPVTAEMKTSWKNALAGRVLAVDLDASDERASLRKGTVLTPEDVDAIAREFDTVTVYSGVYAKGVKLNNDNVSAVLNLGSRMYVPGRVTVNGTDLYNDDGELLVDGYRPIDDGDEAVKLSAEDRKFVTNAVMHGDDVTMWLIGAAVQVIYIKDEDGEPVKLIGIDPLNEKHTITMPDMYALYNYELTMLDGVGTQDDIDMLSNRRIRTVGELLQNQFRMGLVRCERGIRDKMSTDDNLNPKSLTNIRPLQAAIKEFFSSSQLSQFMDQENPLAMLSNKRRISALGPGGLTRERAGFEVRDIHNSHYGRICPIETPEGPNIGLIGSLTTYGIINKYGFIEAPFRKIDKETGRVLDEVVYMTADVEDNYRVAQANEPLDKEGHFLNNRITIRYRDEFAEVDPSVPDYMDVSPKMLVSVATAMIPFLENDDANRALMGSNMQRQAVPLMVTDSPIVGTGMEYKAAVDSGSVVLAKNAGTVKHVDADHIEIETEDGTDNYELIKFMGSNQGTCINQRPIVDLGQEVTKGQVIADGPATSNGEISLGKNALIGFMTWEGYNYEDAVLLNEKLIRDDVYTSIHIEEFELESRDTKLGPEEITRDIPNVGEDALANLDEEGIIHVGAEVKSGDILVGKVTPKGETERTAEERLLQAIFGEKAREVRDTSLRVPHGEYGIVLNVEVFTRANSDELSPGVNKVVRVYIAQKRKIQVGDKMAGRHGNKGVVSRVLPQEDMPFLPDGTPLDIVLNPLGVPSRMNIGQVLEVNIGMAARSKGWKIMTPVFDGAHEEDIQYFLVESKLLAQGNDQTKQLVLDYEDKNEEKGFSLDDLMDLLRKNTEDEAELALIEEAYKGRDGKTVLMDGRTGLPLGDRVTVGVMYYLKLHHLVDDKIHARSTGPYSLVTQQPLGGKAQFGGQRFGEMEVWALEAYGAAYTLQEILTVKSDDIVGRVKTYEAIVKGQSVPKSGVPESFKVLIKELQALGLDVRVLDKDDNEIDLRQNFDGDDIGFRLAENDDMKSVNDAEGASGYMTLDEQGEPMETEDEFDEFTADEEPTAEDLDSLSFDE